MLNMLNINNYKHMAAHKFYITNKAYRLQIIILNVTSEFRHHDMIFIFIFAKDYI